MGLEKLELLAQKLIQLEDDYDAYEFADTYDDYLSNIDDDKYEGIVGDTMSAIVNNSYEILNELEDMYYDVEGIDEEMADNILSLIDEVEIYSNYTSIQRVNENRLLEAYLNKKEITMENKFESIIRGRKTFTELKHIDDLTKLSKQELEQRRKDIIKDLTSNFTEKEVDKQTNPTVKRLMSEIQEIDKYLESKELKENDSQEDQRQIQKEIDSLKGQIPYRIDIIKRECEETEIDFSDAKNVWEAFNYLKRQIEYQLDKLETECENYEYLLGLKK